MVFVSGLDSKTYWEQLVPGGPIPEVPCPGPSCNRCLRGHGWHRRYLDGQRVPLRRLRCHCCRVSHVLLPEDVCAYQDLTLTALEETVEASGPSAAARAAGRHDAVTVRRARRRRHSSIWKMLIFLLPAAGTLWQRIEAIVGGARGKLVRLRRWLWKRLHLLLGGPAGLFREGRPRGYPGGPSP